MSGQAALRERFFLSHQYRFMFDTVPRVVFLLLTCAALLYFLIPFTPFNGYASATRAVLAFIGLYVFFRYGDGVRWITPVKLLIATIITCAASWLAMRLDHPDIARSGPAIEEMVDKFLFLFIAVAMTRRVNMSLFFWVVGAGVLILPWTLGGGLTEISAGLNGARTNFGLNPIRIGVLNAFLLLGLICLGPRCVFHSRFRFVVGLAWILAIILSLIFLVTSQTRTAWVSLIPSVVAGILLLLFYTSISRKIKNRIFVLLLAAFISLLSLIHYSGLSGMVLDRFKSEAPALQLAYEGNFDEIPDTSWGLRIQMWVLAGEGFLARPWAGWGYHGGEKVLQIFSGPDQEKLRSFGQVHNAYLEVLVSYGIFGFLVFVMLFLWGWLALLKIYRHNLIGHELFLFLSMALVFLMTAMTFDDEPFTTEGVLLHNLIFGVIAAFYYQLRRGRLN